MIGDNNCHDNDYGEEDVELVLPLNPPSLVAWGWRCLSISLMMVIVDMLKFKGKNTAKICCLEGKKGSK